MGIGTDWIRSHPTPISGDIIHMTDPPAEWMDQYFDFAPTLMLHYGGMLELPPWMAHAPNAPWISWVWRDGTSPVGQLITGEQYIGRIGYQVGDEPTSSAIIQEIAAGIAALKAQDPNGLCIINMGPNTGQSLANQAADVADVLSIDAYRLSRDIYAPIGRVRSAALDAAIPYWCYLGNKGEESDLWWTAMTHVAFGFTGFCWWLYQRITPPNPGYTWVNFFDAVDDYSAAIMPSWHVARAINQMLARFGAWMPWVYSANVRYVTPCTGLFCNTGGLTRWKYTTSIWGGGSSNTSEPYITGIEPSGADFLFSHLRSVIDQDSYVMLQNCRHAGGQDQWTAGTMPANVTLRFADGVPGGKLRMFNQDDGSIYEQPVTNEVTFLIPAGRLVAFKYDTGLPWAGIET